MQEMTNSICNNAKVGTTGQLKDSRDNSMYTVTKIKNQTTATALCWMTQNLKLVGDKTLTSSNSDVTSNFSLSASVIMSSSDSPKKFSSYNTYEQQVYYNNSQSEYGAYYNWYTATAGTVTENITSGNIASSICPKGWRLPTGGYNTGEFYNLLNKLTVAQITDMPYNFTKSGYISNGKLTNSNSEGRYWSSTAYIGSVTYGLSFTNSTINPSETPSRYHGGSIRCVAR